MDARLGNDLTVAVAVAGWPVAAATADAPATNYDPVNHSQNVYCAGTAGSLQEVAWVAGSGWGPISVVVPAGSLAFAPATN